MQAGLYTSASECHSDNVTVICPTWCMGCTCRVYMNFFHATNSRKRCLFSTLVSHGSQMAPCSYLTWNMPTPVSFSGKCVKDTQTGASVHHWDWSPTNYMVNKHCNVIIAENISMEHQEQLVRASSQVMVIQCHRPAARVSSKQVYM